MSQREPQTIQDVPAMATPPLVQRVLGGPACLPVVGFAAGGVSSAEPSVASRGDEEDAALADVAVPEVRTLADLEALAGAAHEPSNDGETIVALVAAAELRAGAAEEPWFDPAGGEEASQHVPEPGRSGLVLDAARAPQIDLAGFRRSVADDCADRLLSLGRDRQGRPLGERVEGERRLLCQIDALVCLGGAGLSAMADWHEERVASASGVAATWAMVFALACLEGREPLEALVERMGGLPPGHVTAAASAFATSPNPHAVPLGRELLSTGPVGRAIAVELLSLRGRIGVGDLIDWLERGEPLVQAAALRGLGRAPELETSPPLALALLASPDPAVAWEAARAVTLWGSHAAHTELRRGGGLVETLGPRAAEIYVMTGAEDDLERLQRIVSRHDMTPALLSAIGRYGHPTTWEFLGHFLGDPLLGDDAREALHTLFGRPLPTEAESDRFAWRDAIAALRLSPQIRYRRGQPWSPAVVAAEWRDGKLSAQAIASRLDELRARAGVRQPVALHAWRPEPERALGQVAAAADRASRSFRAGSWTFR